MSELTKYCIVLDNFRNIYYSGQNVTGKVIVHVREEIQFKGIFAKIVGQVVMPTYSSEFFEVEQPVIGAENLTSLKPGKYNYLFSLELPLYLPSSFKGQYGTIRYVCSSKFDQPFKFDPSCKIDLFILELADLNLISNAGEPGQTHVQEEPGLICCRKSGTIDVNVRINKQGFVPGETMYIQADVKNQSQTLIESVSAEISCDLYYAHGKHGVFQTLEICRYERPGIPSGSSDKWTDVRFIIPPLSPAQDGNICNGLIRLSYKFQFVVHLEGFFTPNIRVEYPITIGAVPLRKDFPIFIPENALTGQLQLPKIRQYPDLPSPTYKEHEYALQYLQSHLEIPPYMFYKTIENEQIKYEKKN